jgi:hypothetical protein
MVLPLGEAGVKEIPSEPAVLKVMQESIRISGHLHGRVYDDPDRWLPVRRAGGSLASEGRGASERVGASSTLVGGKAPSVNCPKLINWTCQAEYAIFE